jgi:hypothetical protein
MELSQTASNKAIARREGWGGLETKGNERPIPRDNGSSHAKWFVSHDLEEVIILGERLLCKLVSPASAIAKTFNSTSNFSGTGTHRRA